MRIRFYVPNFVDFDPPPPADFVDMAAFFELPKIKHWAGSTRFTHFRTWPRRFDMRGKPDEEITVSAVMGAEGSWVVGFVTGGDLDGLEEASRAHFANLPRRPEKPLVTVPLEPKP